MKISRHIQILLLSISFFYCSSVLAQVPNPCFGPDPATHPVLYVSLPSCPDYNADYDVALLGLTNFEPIANGFAGNWTIEASSTAAAVFAPDPNNAANLLDAGSTATLIVNSTGVLTITNEVDNFNIPAIPWGSCTQSYTVECFESDIADNPPITTVCPSKVLLLLDESGSIETSGATATVESAVMALVSELAGGETEMAIVEFESSARAVPIGGLTAFQSVDATYVTNVSTYLTGASSLPSLGTGNSNPQDPNSYTPGEDVDAFIGATNWEDALQEATAIGGADIVIVLTDGNPTFYNDPIAGATGEGNILDMTALVQARNAANILKAGGSHLFFIGLGDVLTQPIIESSGDEAYVLGASTAAFCTADYFDLDQGCANVTDCITEIANHIISKQICNEAIPTMGEWGLICLSILFMIFGVVSIKQPIFVEARQSI